VEFQWSPFTQGQNLTASNPSGCTFFQPTSTMNCIAVAEYVSGGTNYDINSRVWTLQGTNWVLLQSLPTRGVLSYASFTLGVQVFLIAANSYDTNNGVNTPSDVYVWRGTLLDYIGSITTVGATWLEFITIGADSYIFAANGGSTISMLYNVTA